MKEIKKPEKRFGGNTRNQQIINGAYNQGLDDMESYHEQEMLKGSIKWHKAGWEDAMRERPSLSVEEIIKMIKENDMFMPGIDDQCCEDLALAIKEKMEVCNG